VRAPLGRNIANADLRVGIRHVGDEARVRIIAGEFRGRRLGGPKGSGIRPTSDRVREALFSKISTRLAGAEVLDLFAGSGALGLEALSRGASRVLFVDQGAESIRLLRANIAACGAADRCRVVRAAIPAVLHQLLRKNVLYDLILLDPPYGKGFVEPMLPVLFGLASAEALLVVEHRVSDRIDVGESGWVLGDARAYGDTRISFLVRAE